MKSPFPFFLLLFLSFLPLQAFPFPLKIINFNTWGVPTMVQDTGRYWDAMAALEAKAPDLIVLQELFSPKGRGAFHSVHYPHEVRGPKGFPRLLPSGVRILSKFPILRSFQVVFCRCTGADCLAKKGAVLAIVQLPEGMKLNLVATHLDSGTNESVRISQLEQIEDLIKSASDPNAPLMLSGDLNFNERSIEYAKLISIFKVKDTWNELHDSSEPGYTYDAFENRYAHDYSIKTHEPLLKQRIDYILYKPGSQGSLRPLTSSLIFNTEPLYSDHYGLESDYSLE